MWESERRGLSEGRRGRGRADRELVRVREAEWNQEAVTRSRRREGRKRRKEEVDPGETV